VAPHAMTIRLDPGVAEDLSTVAAVDGQTVSDAVRQAVSDYVAARKADPRFRASLREHLARMRRMLGDEAA